MSHKETRELYTAAVIVKIRGASRRGTVAIAERQFQALLGVFGARKHHG